MRSISVTITALFLSACNVEALAEKILPDNVKAHSHEVVNAVLEEDAPFFEPLRAENLTIDEFQAAIEEMFSYHSDGAEISRHIVSASTNKSFNSEGTFKLIEIVHEVKTEGGYTLISNRYEQKPGMDTCCDLTFVNVQKFDESPYYEDLVSLQKISKIVGISFLLLFLFLGIFIVRRSRKKRLESMS